jgi:hypothetical protein
VTQASAVGWRLWPLTRQPRNSRKSEPPDWDSNLDLAVNQPLERPIWLDLAHKKLDAAVAAAYAWPSDLAEEEILARLLKLNLTRAGF